MGNYIWTPGAVMYRRAVIDVVGGFDARAGGSADFDLNIRIARQWSIHCQVNSFSSTGNTRRARAVILLTCCARRYPSDGVTGVR